MSAARFWVELLDVQRKLDCFKLNYLRPADELARYGILPGSATWLCAPLGLFLLEREDRGLQCHETTEQQYFPCRTCTTQQCSVDILQAADHSQL